MRGAQAVLKTAQAKAGGSTPPPSVRTPARWGSPPLASEGFWESKPGRGWDLGANEWAQGENSACGSSPLLSVWCLVEIVVDGVTGNTSVSGTEKSWFEPRSTSLENGKLAPLAQLVEAHGLGPCQCGFESHGGHLMMVAGGVMGNMPAFEAGDFPVRGRACK